MTKCPFCAEDVAATAASCPQCGRSFPIQPLFAEGVPAKPPRRPISKFFWLISLLASVQSIRRYSKVLRPLTFAILCVSMMTPSAVHAGPLRAASVEGVVQQASPAVVKSGKALKLTGIAMIVGGGALAWVGGSRTTPRDPDIFCVPAAFLGDCGPIISPNKTLIGVGAGMVAGGVAMILVGRHKSRAPQILTIPRGVVARYRFGL